MPAKRFDGDSGRSALEPALKPGLAGGWLYERDAHLRPDRLMLAGGASWSARRRRSASIARSAAFVQRSGRARAVVTAAGRVAGRRLRRRHRRLDAAA